MFSISKSPDVRATSFHLFFYLIKKKTKFSDRKRRTNTFPPCAMFSVAHFLHDLTLFVTLLLSPPSSRRRNQLPLVKNYGGTGEGGWGAGKVGMDEKADPRVQVCEQQCLHPPLPQPVKHPR